MDAKVVGQNIAKLRRKHKMTQKELADALFVVDKTISRWECGYGFPDVKLLPVIADMFHVSVDELIGNEQVDEENSKKSKKKKRIFRFVISALLSSLVLSLFPIVIVSLSNRIDDHSWVLAKDSGADYSFISVFNDTETVSLELKGNLKEGNFVCTNTWYDSKKAEFYDTQIKGTYQIGVEDLDNNIICFYTSKVIDPHHSGKFKKTTELDIPYFYATLESNVVEDSSLALFDKENLEAIVFQTSEEEQYSHSSFFGSYAKESSSFSRKQGEIYFSKVKENDFTTQQYSNFPAIVLQKLNINVPTKLELEHFPYKMDYRIGEKINIDGIKINLVYGDLTKTDVTSKCEILQNGQYVDYHTKQIEISYSDEYVIKKTQLSINVEDQKSWDIAQNSDSDFVYFTFFKNGNINAFSCIEMDGSLQEGTFLTSETYGKNGFINSIYALGNYKLENNEYRFYTTKVFTNKESVRFVINQENEYYSATIEKNNDDIIGIGFPTSIDSKNYFGYYANEEITEKSISHEYGEVYFERVYNNELSNKVINLLSEYGLI